MTKMKRSASSREKTAVRLSPPDSITTSSRPANWRWKLATALRFRAGIVADRRVRAAAGLDADDPLQRQHLAAREELGVLVRVDVVGDDREVDLGPGRGRASSTRAVLPEPDRPGHADCEDLRDGPAYRAGPGRPMWSWPVWSWSLWKTPSEPGPALRCPRAAVARRPRGQDRNIRA